MTHGTNETNTSRPLALVTGASTGIGRAFVELLAGEGHDIIAVARSKEPMEAHGAELAQTCGASVTTLALDLTRDGAAEAVEEAVRRDGRPLCLLVNNAGYGVLGAFADKPRLEELGMMTLNNHVLVDLTHRFLPDLIRTRGGIINIASLAAWMPMPYLSVYSATKAFVKVFSKMLALEVKDKGVRVCAVCPGYTKTPFLERAGVDKVEIPRFVPMQTPQAVAAEGYGGWKRGRRVVITGRANRLTAYMAWGLQPVFNLIGRIADRRAGGPE
jgi:hypothetical protein